MNLNFDVMHFFVFVITQMYFHLCLSSLRCTFICVCHHSDVLSFVFVVTQITFVCVVITQMYFRLCCHHSDVICLAAFEMLLVFDSKSADVYSVNFVDRVNTIM